MNSLYKYIRPFISKKEPLVFEVEDEVEITDEIERSLWLIKEELDLPTEEIQASIISRRKNIKSK
jgi:hypothetical protein